MSHPTRTKETVIHTPNVTLSKTWRIGIIIFLSLIFLILATIFYIKYGSKSTNVNYILSKEIELGPGETKTLIVIPNTLYMIANGSIIDCTGNIEVYEEHLGVLKRSWNDTPGKSTEEEARSGCTVRVKNKTNKTISAWYSAWK